MASREKKLFPREKIFADTYMSNGLKKNKAALIAGYSANCAKQSANAVFNRPRVKKYIEKHMKEAAEKLGITQEYLLSKLKLGLDRTIVEKQVSIPDPATIKAGVSCINELNRMLGNHAPELTQTNGKLVIVEGLLEEMKK